jgi:hypothetical protein
VADSSRRGLLIGTYMAAAVLGGAVGVLALGRSGNASTPAARLGYALREEHVQAGPEAWAGLKTDVETVRATVKGQDREVLDLVMALRGLTTGGATDWPEAEKLCRGLKWPRCDRGALEEMKRSSRP